MAFLRRTKGHKKESKGHYLLVKFLIIFVELGEIEITQCKA